MADLLALRALVTWHDLEWERAHRRSHRWRRFRSVAHRIVLDRLADAAQQALTDAETRYRNALDAGETAQPERLASSSRSAG